MWGWREWVQWVCAFALLSSGVASAFSVPPAPTFALDYENALPDVAATMTTRPNPKDLQVDCTVRASPLEMHTLIRCLG